MASLQQLVSLFIRFVASLLWFIVALKSLKDARLCIQTQSNYPLSNQTKSNFCQQDIDVLVCVELGVKQSIDMVEVGCNVTTILNICSVNVTLSKFSEPMYTHGNK